MIKFRKGLAILAVTMTVGAASILAPFSAMGTTNGIDTTVINEKWGKPTFVYGGGLSEAQITETAELLEIENRDNVNSMPVTGEDLKRYLSEGEGDTSSMISSVLVQKQDADSGVEVIVKTPDNITQITSEQYANAAITAGVTDAQIIVASVSRVTGESALTGIYKAFDANGEDLDQAIIEIKQSLAELKEQQGELATREDIERIIQEALANFELENIVTQEQIDRLLQLFEKYQQTSAIDSTEVREQLSNLANTVQDKVSDLIGQAEESGWLDRIGNFFSEIWQSILNLFN